MCDDMSSIPIINTHSKFDKYLCTFSKIRAWKPSTNQAAVCKLVIHNINPINILTKYEPNQIIILKRYHAETKCTDEQTDNPIIIGHPHLNAGPYYHEKVQPLNTYHSSCYFWG